jgi:tetratricopeptide (TPR) repeat protein
MRNGSIFFMVFANVLLAAGLWAQPPAATMRCAGMDRMLPFLGRNYEHLPARAREAEQLRLAGDLPSALRAYEEAASKNSEDWMVLFQLGELQLKLGHTQDAIVTINKANAIMETVFGYGDLGMIYEQSGDSGSAMRSYRRAAELCPGLPGVYANIARAGYALGLYDEAARAVETGLKTPPLQLVANPAPGSLESADREYKSLLNSILADIYVARGLYSEASKILGERKLIGASVDPVPEGIRVTMVRKGYPLDLAGFVPGDILVSINGESLAGAKLEDLTAKLQKVQFGTAVKVSAIRNGKPVEADVVVGVPADLAALAKKGREAEISGAGVPLSGTAAPSIRIERLEVVPGGTPGAFDAEIAFAATDPGETGPLTVQYSYRILQGKQVLFTEPTVILNEPNGALRLKVQHLTVPKAAGKYVLQVALLFKGTSAEKSVELEIE